MKSTIGGRRRITDAQVEQIRAMEQVRRAWLARRSVVPTRKQLAKKLGIPENTLIRVTQCPDRYFCTGSGKRKRGRPPSIHGPVIDLILAWRRELTALQARRKEIKTQGQWAQEFGVSQTAVGLAASGHHYKSASPERREDELRKRHRHIEQLRERGLM